MNDWLHVFASVFLAVWISDQTAGCWCVLWKQTSGSRRRVASNSRIGRLQRCSDAVCIIFSSCQQRNSCRIRFPGELVQAVDPTLGKGDGMTLFQDPEGRLRSSWQVPTFRSLWETYPKPKRGPWWVVTCMLCSKTRKVVYKSPSNRDDGTHGQRNPKTQTRLSTACQIREPGRKCVACMNSVWSWVPKKRCASCLDLRVGHPFPPTRKKQPHPPALAPAAQTFLNPVPGILGMSRSHYFAAQSKCFLEYPRIPYLSAWG